MSIQTITEIAAPEVVTRDSYRDSVSSKISDIQRLPIAESTVENLSEYEISQAVAYLNHIMVDPHEVVGNIHDLWSARQFSNGLSYGERTDTAAMTSHLLTPYAELKDKGLEDALALGDMKGIRNVLRLRFPQVNNEESLSLEMLSVEQKAAIIKVMCAISKDNGSIDEMSRSVHDTWIAAKMAHGFTQQNDPRIATHFDQLDAAVKETTRENARLDILAVAITML